MFVPFDEERGLHPQDQDFLEHERVGLRGHPAGQVPAAAPLPVLPALPQAGGEAGGPRAGDALARGRVHARAEARELRLLRAASPCATPRCRRPPSRCWPPRWATSTLARDYLEEAAQMDLDDLAHNTADGLHMASLAGAVLAAVAGFGGVRDYCGRLSFRPRLPEGIERLRLLAAGARRRAARRDRPGARRAYTLAQGDSVRFPHWDEEISSRAASAVQAADPAARGGGAAHAAAGPRAARGPLAAGLAGRRIPAREPARAPRRGPARARLARRPALAQLAGRSAAAGARSRSRSSAKCDCLVGDQRRQRGADHRERDQRRELSARPG